MKRKVIFANLAKTNKNSVLKFSYQNIMIHLVSNGSKYQICHDLMK